MTDEEEKVKAPPKSKILDKFGRGKMPSAPSAKEQIFKCSACGKFFRYADLGEGERCLTCSAKEVEK